MNRKIRLFDVFLIRKDDIRICLTHSLPRSPPRWEFENFNFFLSIAIELYLHKCVLGKQ